MNGTMSTSAGGLSGGRDLGVPRARAGTARRRGFTLVELLVVVGIIALLVTILMPALGRALELTRKTICQTNLGIMGRGWLMYWQDNRNTPPPMVTGDKWSSPDSISQYNDQLWGCWKNWTGAGFLWKLKYVEDHNVYACPTVKKSVGGEWWEPTGTYGGPWPVHQGCWPYSWTTYGMRRMANYDDPNLADLDRWDVWAPQTKDIMLMRSGFNGITSPANFSYMADCFRRDYVALRSHVPKVNVLWLDGHVKDFEDTTDDGSILYGGNGITGNNQNWLHDDIWMIIDGYHKPPVGSGNK
ncbi:MAG TPA: type II secretion system protein [Phycisphaerae bacterium]|nr:type II secretion system protein [Phycisphaerae bacterium]